MVCFDIAFDFGKFGQVILFIEYKIGAARIDNHFIGPGTARDIQLISRVYLCGLADQDVAFKITGAANSCCKCYIGGGSIPNRIIKYIISV